MGSAPLGTSAPEHVLEQWGAPEQLFVGFGGLPGNLDRLRAWDCVPEHVLGAPGSLRSTFLVLRSTFLVLRSTGRNFFFALRAKICSGNG